ncbi:hypothetical protein [Psychromarinibacter sp. S121]
MTEIDPVRFVLNSCFGTAERTMAHRLIAWWRGEPTLYDVLQG